MSNATCSIEGCGQKVNCRGLCSKHYARLRRTGSTERVRPPATCTVDGCERPYLAKGLCQLHRDRLRRNGTLEVVRFTNRPCSVDGCDEDSKTRGYCGRHYARWLRRGDVGPAGLLLTPNPIVDGKRQCRQCLQSLPVENFNKGSWPGALHHKCRECQRADNVAWREANPDYWKNWQKANPDKVLAIAHKRRAQKLSREHEDIDRDRVFAASDYTCKLCGEPLDMSAKFPAPLSPSVDHIIPLNKGGAHLYTNVQAAHFVCNSAKGDRILV